MLKKLVFMAAAGAIGRFVLNKVTGRGKTDQWADATDSAR
ncbi:MAG: DLW-39 family protein [Nocardioidaceae bacterium]